MSEETEQEYVDPNSGRVVQPGSAFPGMIPPQVFASEPEAEPEAEAEAAEEEVEEEVEVEEPEEAEEEAYDPSKHSVADVLAHVAEHPELRDEILAAELDGKSRSTLIAELEAE